MIMMIIIIIIIIIIIGASNLELQFSVLLFSDFHFKALAFSVSNVHCSYKLPKEVMTRHRNFAGQSICLLVCLSIHLNNLSLDPSIHPSTYLSLFIYLSVYLTHLSIYLFIYLSKIKEERVIWKFICPFSFFPASISKTYLLQSLTSIAHVKCLKGQ